MQKILFFGNSAQMNYVAVKYLRKYSSYKPDLLLQDYNSIYDHPAWDDVPIKIPQDTILTNPKEAFDLFTKAIEKNNWKMEEWIYEHPIKLSIYDKLSTKYLDKFHTIKKQIHHYVNDMQKYDFIISDGFGSISAFLAKVPYAVKPYGSDIDILPFENNHIGKLAKKTYQNSVAVLGTFGLESLSKIEGTQGKRKNAGVIIDTEKFIPKLKSKEKKISFFYASRLDFKLKKHDKAIRAFKKLLKTYDSELYFIEYGSDVTETHNLVKQLKIEKNVKFYNFTASKPVMAQLYTMHDAIIANLAFGHVGTTELEAMSCDKPVIAYVKIKFDLEKKLPILNAFTEEEIYQKMIDVCENRNLPSGMRQFIEKYFGIEHFLEHLHPLLNNAF